jgi:hypothetical protein
VDHKHLLSGLPSTGTGSGRKKLCVLHGPTNVGNQPWVLSRAERRLGVRSDLAVTSGNWLGYRADRRLRGPDLGLLGSLISLGSFAAAAPFRYDVLHCYFGTSFLNLSSRRFPFSLPFLDLKLWRWLGRKVVMTFQGCDVRQSDRSTARDPLSMCQLGHCTLARTCRARLDDGRRRMLDHLLPLCDRIFVLNPELAHEVPEAVFLPYASVNVEALQPVWPRTNGRIVLLHAPTNEGIKGTRYLVAAVDRLKRRWPIELSLVKKVPHAQALQLYRQADLVVDQLLGGWYGGFAVEAMALGKPVGCYIREGDLNCLSPAFRADLPLIRLTVPTLEQDLEAVLERRAEWPEWGKMAREFVLRWHHPLRIAHAMIRTYLDPASQFDLEPEPRATAA